MTTVHVSMARDDGTGTLAAVSGSLYWEPTTRREDGTVVVLPVGFAMSLVAGEATKDVEPSGLTWCWRVTERVQDGTVRYVSVADSATTLEYVDLPDVDPDTLVAWSPADPEAAYQAALDAIEVTGGVTSVDGKTGAVSLSDTYVAQDDAPELIRDTMGSVLVAGDGVTITPDDGADTITIAASGGGGSVTSTMLTLSLYDPATMYVDNYWVSSTGTIAAENRRGYVRVPVTAGETYTIHREDFPTWSDAYGALRFEDATETFHSYSSWAAFDSVKIDGYTEPIKVVTIPTGVAYMCFNVYWEVTLGTPYYDARTTARVWEGDRALYDQEASEGIDTINGEPLVDSWFRDQVGSFSTLTTDNLFDHSEAMMIAAKITSGDTFYSYAKSATVVRMAKVPVTAGATYSYGYDTAPATALRIGYLDSAGAFISSEWPSLVNQHGWTFIPPTGAEYVIIHARTDGASAFNEIDTLHVVSGVDLRPDEVVEVQGYEVRDAHSRALAASRWTGKQWVAFGDSITELSAVRAEKNYWGHIRDRIGVNVTDKGLGSASIHEFATGTANNLSIDIYERVKTVPTTADLVTVMIGTNDFTQGLATVAIGTETDTTDATIAGCIYLTIQNLMAIVPNATIAFITPLPRMDGGYPSYPGGELTSPGGWTMTQLADTIIAVCRRYNVPVLDAYRASFLKPWNATNVKTYTYAYDPYVDGDGLHPNDAGMEAFSWQVQAFLDSL